MRSIKTLLPGVLLLASTTLALSQSAPAEPAATEPAATEPAATEPAADKLLLKVGLNAARVLRHSGYYGIASRIPLTVGAEYALSPRFTLFGQADVDFGVPTKGYYEDNKVVPTAALGFGSRYYYNQAGRARNNRPHGPFVGNYLAVEGHVEMQQFQRYSFDPVSRQSSYTYQAKYAPSLNLLWGMQRRLGRSFLFDFNAGLGLSAWRNDQHFWGYSSGPVNVSTHINMGIYFGR